MILVGLFGQISLAVWVLTQRGWLLDAPFWLVIACCDTSSLPFTITFLEFTFHLPEPPLQSLVPPKAGSLGHIVESLDSLFTMSAVVLFAHYCFPTALLPMRFFHGVIVGGWLDIGGVFRGGLGAEDKAIRQRLV